MQKALFITNSIYVDLSKKEGGVRNCTQEFINLIKVKFEVIVFKVDYDNNFLYKIRVRLGLNIYNDYKPQEYKSELIEIIKRNNPKFIFLNLSNTMTFSSIIKKINPEIKVVLCSHGNESGDYLHQSVKFIDLLSFFKRMTSTYTLGALLKKESLFRQQYIDMVLSISEVEENIEKWLGAKKVFMVPRTILPDFKLIKSQLNKVGFIGDLSHTPNYTGIISYCDQLSKLDHEIKFCIVGGPKEIGETIQSRYSFVYYKGFLEEKELLEEISTWSYFLNLVFYYSRGVSTKLAKALGWGLPVLTTIEGNRGYKWQNGTLNVCNNAQQMALQTIEYAGDLNKIMNDQEEVINVVQSSPDFVEIMEELYPILLTC